MNGRTRAILSAVGAACLCVVLASAAWATQGRDVRYSAHLDPGVVKLGDATRLVVQVLNARDARILELPEVDGLRFGRVGNPSSTTSIVLRNGRREQSSALSWVVAVQPERTGEFTIAGLKLEIDGAEVLAREMVLKVREDLRGGELGRFAFVGLPERVYEGQVFTLDIEFGWDMAIDSTIGGADLSLPWWTDLSGVLDVGDPPPLPGERVTVGLNSRDKVQVIETGAKEIDGRNWRTFRLRKRVIATRPGTLEFPASFLEFVQLLERGRGTLFLSEPDRTESYFVGAPAFAIDVRPLPEEGRPFDFSGAVGRFQVRASENRRDVDAGESIKLAVEWSGEGNLEFFEPPDLARLESFAGFAKYGRVDRHGPNGRQVVYDISPRSSRVESIPPVPLVVFDTERGEYVTLWTEEIPIRVRDLEGATGLDEPTAPLRGVDIRDVRAVVPEAPPARIGGAALGSLLATIPLGWLILRTLVRRHGDPDSASARRRRGALRALQRELARATAARGQSEALADFLAARTQETREAWIGRDLGAWARARDLAGAERELVDELAALRRELDERAWAGKDEPLERERLLVFARKLVAGGW